MSKRHWWQRLFSGGAADNSRGLRAIQRARLRASYDAAATTSDNARHWVNADVLSADAANSPEVRRILRARARYERANNTYCAGIVNTLACYGVGTGPRLQITPEEWPKTTTPEQAREITEAIERAWHAWADEASLADKLALLRACRAVDGEGIAVFKTNPRLRSDIKLDLELVEADQLATPDLYTLGTNAVDGIVFDEYGNPAEYHILREHPGSNATTLGFEYDRVPAERVIHYYRQDRPGQSRGIPDITPAIPLFAQLRRYTLAVIAAAETAADFAAVIESDAPASDDDEQPEPMDTITLEQRLATVLPGGWKLGQIKAEQPTTSYSDFKHEIINEIARVLDMPFNIAAGNSSAYNYASGRLDHQTFYRSIARDRRHLERHVLDRVLAAWLQEAVLVSGLLPTRTRTAVAQGLIPGHLWFWDGGEHVDPAKEATAQAARLASHTTTLAAEYARQGRDWEVELRQRARELALMRELGLDTPPPTPSTPGQDDEAEETEEAATDEA